MANRSINVELHRLFSHVHLLECKQVRDVEAGATLMCHGICALLWNKREGKKCKVRWQIGRLIRVDREESCIVYFDMCINLRIFRQV